MIPLVFILLVTAVLILMVYWILSNPKKPDHPETTPQRKYDFETAGELFKYVEPVRAMPEENELKLSAHSKYILASWNIKPSTWQEILDEFGAALDYEDLLIRLHDSRLQPNSYELPISDLSGTCHFQSIPGTAYYAVIGVKQADDFIPLFLSNTINTAAKPKK
ncbi:MAG: hypothetical protein PHX14_01305 [Syntrophomonadaceae bacterium]|nr:hypothetical protein [Syntrophomonadaceae bacterium]